MSCFKVGQKGADQQDDSTAETQIIYSHDSFILPLSLSVVTLSLAALVNLHTVLKQLRVG